MLEEITLAEIASYPAKPVVLDGLKKINFIYGSNGSGKTTISRIIDDPARGPKCQLKWAHNRPLVSLVYNSDFADRNYGSQMAGVFTLGEDSKETLTEIEATKAKIDGIADGITSIEVQLGTETSETGKQAELRSLLADLSKACWAVKKKYDEEFKDIFSGVRSSQVKFCDKVLKEKASNTAASEKIEEIRKKASVILGENLTKQTTLDTFSKDGLLKLERHEILKKPIVGKDDVDVAALIKHLQNGDWVRRGLQFLKHSGEQCPFCQQDMSEDLKKKIGEYFDEGYAVDIAQVQEIAESYEIESSKIVEIVEEIVEANSPHIDTAALQKDLLKLESRLAENKGLIERKKGEPSAAVELDSADKILTSIIEIIASGNAKIADHNKLVDNISQERAKLETQIWRFILDELSGELDSYDTKSKVLEKAIAGMGIALVAKRADLAKAKAALKALESKITSVEPTVKAINDTLASFGFTNFSLKTAGTNNSQYAIVRSSGADARATLSEGERCFVTFLYFYHLIRGSVSTSGITEDRIVVFDDPISSLDSDILFIVSALIKRVLQEVIDGKGYVKQVFVLTHNVYFHKEVSFDPKRDRNTCRAHETFWIVRRVANESVVQRFDYNPIRTSYELLWSEVRNAARSPSTIQNTLRRIIENYFTLLGNIDKDEIIGLFQGPEQHICGSLFSWVNDGSHFANDDLYISADENTIQRYLTVFAAIFEKTKHKAHYDMMMGTHAA